MNRPDLAADMAAVAAATDREIVALLPQSDAGSRSLAAAMSYPIASGGKRFRPYLVHAVGRMLGADDAGCRRVGAAIEILHTYSLVHDDLPAMDDAKIRRGRPTCHLAFDEATAILVGDALLALAFEAICRDDWAATAEQKTLLTRKLARAAGGEQLCAGQFMDLSDLRAEFDIEDIGRMQALKTGALIGFSCESACILAASGEAETRAVMTYAGALGLAFQISDDLLDMIGDSSVAGKDLGRDALQAKATFVTLLGTDGARAELAGLRRQAIDATSCLGVNAELLWDLFDFVINRRA